MRDYKVSSIVHLFAMLSLLQVHAFDHYNCLWIANMPLLYMQNIFACVVLEVLMLTYVPLLHQGILNSSKKMPLMLQILPPVSLLM